jgi:hypothetical protein
MHGGVGGGSREVSPYPDASNAHLRALIGPIYGGRKSACINDIIRQKRYAKQTAWRWLVVAPKRSRPRRTYGSSHTEWTIPRTASRSHRDDLRLTAEPGPSPALHPPPTQAEPRLHRQYLVQQVHELVARVMFELLDEIARHPGFDDDLNELLERYVGLDGGVRGAVARAPVRELGHSENSRKEPPDAGGPYRDEQHPRAVFRGDGK